MKAILSPEAWTKSVRRSLGPIERQAIARLGYHAAVAYARTRGQGQYPTWDTLPKDVGDKLVDAVALTESMLDVVGGGFTSDLSFFSDDDVRSFFYVVIDKAVKLECGWQLQPQVLKKAAVSWNDFANAIEQLMVDAIFEFYKPVQIWLSPEADRAWTAAGPLVVVSDNPGGKTHRGFQSTAHGQVSLGINCSLHGYIILLEATKGRKKKLFGRALHL